MLLALQKFTLAHPHKERANPNVNGLMFSKLRRVGSKDLSYAFSDVAPRDVISPGIVAHRGKKIQLFKLPHTPLQLCNTTINLVGGLEVLWLRRWRLLMFLCPKCI